jgi:hypothetical protein
MRTLPPICTLRVPHSLASGDVQIGLMRVIQGTGTLCEVYLVRRCGSIKRWPVHERIELPLNP